ncbi:MAG: Asp-tRNA(Asn)/Glu-tRNA(Gln) amidotransferase subunit GatB [Candidatus Anammoxibacter sp.]
MEYDVVIGLETHAELATDTKLFCGCSTQFGSDPNTQTCPVCLALPGSLPVMNKKAFDLALKAALALNCKVDTFTNFDRKGYYYPDLPKNYQISQNYRNLGTDGDIDLIIDGKDKTVNLHNVHLEEDAGKLVHPENSGVDYSFVDFNRAGIPLLEIVSYPDITCVDEAEMYMQTLRTILLYIKVSDCKMQEGSLRFEASISLKEKGSDKLGTRVEIKNLNSVRAVTRSLQYEIERQTKLLTQGVVIDMETRLWDESNQKTERMRSKEEAQDYRYFPEPDLAPIIIDDEWINGIKSQIPELPKKRLKRFIDKCNLPFYDANILIQEKAIADYFEACVDIHSSPKTISNWINNDVLRELNERKIGIEDFPVKPEMLIELIKLVDNGSINNVTAKTIFSEMVLTGENPNVIVEKKGLGQISDETELESIVSNIIKENDKVVADYKGGKKNALGFLVGKIMQKTKGKANPKVINKMLEDKING